ncbi:hypothetical protein [Actinomadura rifamycini]|uniref:hypothetical protein n=1 Tax=Actinomadura rifamycini TaxID=31962 RepID=UPI0003F9650D|nr:hypothetical protein [Actinomadura rifamycini]
MSPTAVDPAAIAARIPTPDLAGLETAARAIKKDGAAIAATGHRIAAAWSGLRDAYRAPEAGELLAAIRPVPAAGDDAERALTVVGDALLTFVAEARAAIERLRRLQLEAAAFRDEIAGDDDWTHDGRLTEKNDILIGAVAHALAEYQGAERDCANRISSTFGGARYVPAGTPARPDWVVYGADEHNLPDAAETPWGTPGEDTYWWEDVGAGFGTFFGGLLDTFTDLTGLTDTENGAAFGAGLGDIAGNLRDNWTDLAAGLGTAGLALSGIKGKDGWIVDGDGVHPKRFVTNRLDAKASLIDAMVPWREWDDRPGYVLSLGGLNAASLLLEGGGLLKVFGKGGALRHLDGPIPHADLPDTDLPAPARAPTASELQKLIDDLELDERELAYVRHDLGAPDRPGTAPAAPEVPAPRPAPAPSRTAETGATDHPMRAPDDTPAPHDLPTAPERPDDGEPGPAAPAKPEGSESGAPSTDDIPGRGDANESPSASFPSLSPEQLADLRRTEQRARRIAAEHGVDVEFTGYPIDPRNAEGLAEALEGAARDYPSVFRDMEVVRVKSLDDLRVYHPSAGTNLMGYSINNRKGPGPQGLYFNGENFVDQELSNAIAIERAKEGWAVPGGLTAEGTFYHEFGHQLGNRILTDPRLTGELRDELKKIGVSVDPDSLHPAIPFGRRAIEDGMGVYGSQNPSEMLAEGFAEWRMTSNPRPIAAVIGEFIDKHFKGER